MPVLNRPISGGGEIEGIEYTGTAREDIKKNEMCYLQCTKPLPVENSESNAVSFSSNVLDWCQLDENRVLYIDSLYDSRLDSYEVYLNIATINKDEDKRVSPFLNRSSYLFAMEAPGDTALVKLNVPNEDICLVKLGNSLYFFDIDKVNNMSLLFSTTYSTQPNARAYDTYSFKQIIAVDYDGYINDGTFYDFYEFRKNTSSNMFSIDYCKVIIKTKEVIRERVVDRELMYSSSISNLIPAPDKQSNVYYVINYTTNSSAKTTTINIDSIRVPKIGSTNNAYIASVRQFTVPRVCNYFSYTVNGNRIYINSLFAQSTSTTLDVYTNILEIVQNYKIISLDGLSSAIGLKVAPKASYAISCSSYVMYNNSLNLLFSYITTDNVTRYIMSCTVFGNNYVSDIESINDSGLSVRSFKPLVVDDCVYYCCEANDSDYTAYCKIIQMPYDIHLLKDTLLYYEKYVGLAKDNYTVGQQATIIHPTTK